MAGWRIAASLAITLFLANPLRAQSYLLSEDNLVGQHFRVDIRMKLTGEMKIRQDDKTLTYPQSAEARHLFVERILEVNKQGLAAKSARVYQDAQATIVSGEAKSERRFRPERTFQVCQRQDEQPLTYCPKGTFTRDEVELSEHFDVQSLPGLLPGRKVKVGETWDISNQAVQSLCYLDGLTSQDLKGTLNAVKNDVAELSIAGAASGIDLGAVAKITITATGSYDIKAGRIINLTWKQTDERQQGPVSPELKLELTATIARTPIAAVNELNDFALVPVPTAARPPASMTNISYQDPERRFTLTHAREWQVVARTDKHLVMRLLDRGDFVAQATLTPWQKAEPGSHLTAEQFTKAMDNTPGWEEDEALESDETPTNNANWAYRIAATGSLNEVKVVQYFYLVAGPQGDQLVATFTMSPAQTQKLGAHDLELIRSISFGSTPALQSRAD